jgi:hypothetical protein
VKFWSLRFDSQTSQSSQEAISIVFNTRFFQQHPFPIRFSSPDIMFATEESVAAAQSESSRAPFVFKSEPGVDGPSGPGQFHHQLHNVIITPVSSPPSTPATVASPAASPVSFDPSGTSATHPDLSNFSQQFDQAGCNFQNSLPPVPSICRVLTPRTDPTGCEENGITLLGNKYILLDQLEGSNLRRCIHVETQQQYVCKVKTRLFFDQIFGQGVLKG